MLVLLCPSHARIMPVLCPYYDRTMLWMSLYALNVATDIKWTSPSSMWINIVATADIAVSATWYYRASLHDIATATNIAYMHLWHILLWFSCVLGYISVSLYGVAIYVWRSWCFSLRYFWSTSDVCAYCVPAYYKTRANMLALFFSYYARIMLVLCL